MTMRSSWNPPLVTCQGKHRYLCWSHANKQAKRLKAMLIYRCSICQGFHLANANPAIAHKGNKRGGR